MLSFKNKTIYSNVFIIYYVDIPPVRNGSYYLVSIGYKYDPNAFSLF